MVHYSDLTARFRPLAGCKLFPVRGLVAAAGGGFRPLAGRKMFSAYSKDSLRAEMFPSPFGV